LEITEEHLQLLEKVIKETAKIEGVLDGEVAVSLVNDQMIHELNKNYRGIDRPTDVLSFAMNEEIDEDMEFIYDEEEESIPNTLGDIVISIPRTIEQASEYGHSFERELGFLTIHGFLHLLGYDHDKEEEEKVMFEKQEKVLANLELLR